MQFTTLIRRSSASLLAIAAAASTFAANPTPPVKWFVSGYIQPRFTLVNGSSTSGITNSTFDVKRYSLFVRAQLDPHISAVVTPSGLPNTSLLEAYGEYADKTYSARLGLSRIPFGYESPLGSNKLITLERSQVVSQLLVVPGLWYDRGAYVYVKPVDKLNIAAGVANGASTSTAQDPNNGKNVVARVGYQVLPKTIVGISYYDGTVAQTNNGSYVTGTHIDAQRIGADLEATAGQFQIISEALLGKNGDVDAKGGYVTVAYTQGKTQPYVRYDVYDPNTDTANNSFERWTGGVGYYVTPNAKLSLEYEAINDDTQPNLNGRLTTQYQISF